MKRREFIRSGAVMSAMALSVGRMAAAKPIRNVRVGFVGIGVKGSAHVGNLLRMEGVELRAVCDIREIQCREARAQAKALGKPEPKAYTRGDWDFKRMCETEELDLVYTATPWRWHVPVCLAAMENGKHAATEVPAAVTVEDCWKLVETSERTGLHCVMMENANYQRNEMTILNMVRKGLLGELAHGEAGYLHDTRWLKIKDTGDGLWLGNHHADRNGNLYPTHGMGPMAWYMNINRGDRLDYLVSMSSNARGMDLYAKEHLPLSHPKRKRRYRNGDVNTCLIKTVNGLSIRITHDTDLPRPYSRVNLVQGTRGIVRGYPEFKVSIEGDSHRHKWTPCEKLQAEHEHPLWKDLLARTGGKFDFTPVAPINRGAVWDYRSGAEFRNGDWLEDSRLIAALQKGVAPDMDVYDAATWSAIAGLSEKSVANRSQTIDFPDFTKGRWKTMKPVKITGV